MSGRLEVLKVAFIWAVAWIFALAITPSRSMAAPRDPSPFAEAEALLEGYPNLASLLRDHTQLQAYLDEIQKAYGPDKLSKPQINAIVEQLRSIVEQVPELSDQLWRPFSHSIEFEVASERPNFGRTIDNQHWSNFIAPYVRKTTAANRSMSGAQAYRLMIEYRKMEASISANDHRAKIQLRRHPITAQLADYFTARILDSQEIRQTLLYPEANQVLNLLNDVHTNPRLFYRGEIPSLVVSEIKNRIPSLRAMLENRDLFPEITYRTHDGQRKPVGVSSTTPIRFHTPPRVLHSIWAGAAVEECVSGSRNNLADLSPERWARVALKDAIFQTVLRNGRINGFVSINPGDIGRSIYGSVDFASDVFRNDSGSSTVFYKWFEQIESHLPKNWNGIVVSKSQDLNSTHVLENIWKSASYVLGDETLKTPDMRFLIKDPLADKISLASPKQSRLHIKYGGQMIFDATTPNARELHSLVRLQLRRDQDLPPSQTAKTEVRQPKPNPTSFGVDFAHQLAILHNHEATDVLIAKLKDAKTWDDLQYIIGAMRVKKMSPAYEHRILKVFDEKIDQIPIDMTDLSRIQILIFETMIVPRTEEHFPNVLRSFLISPNKEAREMAFNIKHTVYSAKPDPASRSSVEQEMEKYIAQRLALGDYQSGLLKIETPHEKFLMENILRLSKPKPTHTKSAATCSEIFKAS